MSDKVGGVPSGKLSPADRRGPADQTSDEVDVYDLLRVPDSLSSPDVYDFLDVDATMLGTGVAARVRQREEQDRRARPHPHRTARRPGAEFGSTVTDHAASGYSRTTGDGSAQEEPTVTDLAEESEAVDAAAGGAAGVAGETAATPAEPSIRRASVVMAAGTMVSRVLGFVRTFLLTAVAGGTSLALDAFQAANTLPNVIFILLSAGVLNAILIPQITKAMKQPDGGQDFVDRLLTASFGVVLIVAVLATVTSPWLLDLYFSASGATRQLTVLFGFIVMPQIFFYGLYAILGQVLNARSQFAAFMWSPVLANLIQIAGLVWFLVQWGSHPDPATWTGEMVWVLAGFTTLGIAVQGLFLIIPLRRGGFRWRPRFGLRGHGLGAAARITMWTFSALLVSQLVGILTKRLLSWVRLRHPEVSGSVAAYDNAFLVFMLPHSFITTSILTALFPQMSQAFADGDEPRMRRLVRKGLSAPALLIIPCSLAMVVLARPGVQTIFRLQPSQVDVLAWAVAIMGLGLLPFGVSTLQQRYCFAREDGRLNFRMQLVLSGAQLMCLLAIFIAPANTALLIVAAAQTIANTIVSIVWVRVASRQMNGLGMISVIDQWLRLLGASVLAAVPTWFIVKLFGMLGSRWLLNAAATIVGGVAFVGIFVLASKLLRIPEVTDAVAGLGRKLHVVR